MCCRTDVYPLEPEIAAAILKIGLFLPTNPGETVPSSWKRDISTEDEESSVLVTFGENVFAINIAPAISMYDHHSHRRLAASVCFEIAAKYAEKVDGEIFQRANITGCRIAEGISELRLASYPSMHLSYDRICPGFRELFLHPEMS